MRHLHALALAAAVTCGPVSAQPVPSSGPTDAAELEAVVVTARRSGVPVWRVRRGDAVLVVAGHIDAVPAATRWSPTALERAVEMADRVILPARARVTPVDFGRVLIQHRRVLFLPKGKTIDDYIDADLSARLAALHGRGLLEDDYRKRHPQNVGVMLQRAVGARDRGGPDAVRVVQDAAKQHRKPARPISAVAGKGILDTYMRGGPEAYVRCLQLSVALAEAGTAPAEERARAWTLGRVRDLRRTPVDDALSSCGATSPELGRRLRAEWRKAFSDWAARPGATLAVVPLRLLTEDDGLLDALSAQGLEIDGPRWRDDQP